MVVDLSPLFSTEYPELISLESLIMSLAVELSNVDFTTFKIILLIGFLALVIGLYLNIFSPNITDKEQQ